LQAGGIVETFAEAIARTEQCSAVTVDIPIGLPEHSEPGGRECDRLARGMLKPHLHGSVFSTPPRAVLGARSYDGARRIARSHSTSGSSLSRQAYGILPKIREVDECMTPAL
jgi:predicted RNase H-like nuclease